LVACLLAVAVLAAAATSAAAAPSAAAGSGATVVLERSRQYPAAVALTLLRGRLAALHLDGSSVEHHGDRFEVTLPGVTDRSVARQLAAAPVLRFRPVLLSGIAPEGGAVADPTATATVASCNAGAVGALHSIPTTAWADDKSAECVVLNALPSDDSGSRYYLGPSALGSDVIDSAKRQFMPSQGWTVRIDFTPHGSARFDSLAKAQFHKQVALALEGTVMSAPTIEPVDQSFSSFGGTAVVSGTFDERQGALLAAAANGRQTPVFRVKKVTLR